MLLDVCFLLLLARFVAGSIHEQGSLGAAGRGGAALRRWWGPVVVGSLDERGSLWGRPDSML